MYFKSDDFEIEKFDGLAPLVGAAIVAGAASLANGILQGVTNERNLDSQNSWNQKNLAFSREQFEYQKMLNANQYQIAASDMQKAGINPAMAAGGVNLTSGSYSSGTSNNFNSTSPQVDISPLIQLASAQIGSDTQKQVAKGTNDTSKEVADIQSDASKYVSDNQVKIAEENRKTQELIASERNKTDAEIAKNKLNEENRANKARESNEVQIREDNYGIAQQKISQMQKELDYWYERLRKESNAKLRADILNTINTLETNMFNLMSAKIRSGR